MATVGSIVSGAFRVVRERPLAVAVWGLLYLASTLLFMLAMRPFLATQASGDPSAAMRTMGSMMSLLFLLEIAFFLLALVLFTGAMRAVLQPEQRGFFHLRLGLDEFHMVILGFGLAIAFYIAFFLFMILIGLLVAALFAAGGVGVAITVAAIAGLAAFGALIWVEVRISLAFPLTLLRRRLVLAESWRLTRGRFWSLFGGYFCVALIILALWIVAALISSSSYLSAFVHGGFDPRALRAAQQEQIARQLSMDPLFLLSMVAGAVVGGVSIALWGGALATAARELTVNTEEIAATFA